MQSRVITFMKGFGQTIRPVPSLIPPDERDLREALICEEYSELLRAMHTEDLIEIADGIADLLYVIIGTACSYGINIEDVFSEVHRSNMTKIGAPLRGDGKVLKPSTFSPPDIPRVLREQSPICCID